MRINKILKALLLASMSCVSISAFAPVNFLPYYDPNWLHLPAAPVGNPFRLGVNVEASIDSQARNNAGHQVNVLQVYDAQQALIPMLINSNNPAATALLQALTIAASPGPLDDGIRGHFVYGNGAKFSMVDVTPFARYIFPLECSVPGELSLAAALPIRFADVRGTNNITDLTRSIFAVDLDIKALIANLNATVTSLGGPNMNNWNKTGLGDLVVLVEWKKNYPQEKQDLRNVYLHAKLGFTAPTGVLKDENRAFSVALGNDGAWGLPFGLGLDLDFPYHIRFGAEAEFFVLFDDTKTRRVKTEQHQTEFLLLNTARVSKNHGFTWKFYLYLQGYHMWRGLSLKFAYEYEKHDSDRLTLVNNAGSSMIANSANSLREWNKHDLFFMLNYDFWKEAECWGVKPQLSFFYKLPVGGKNIINPQTVGGQFALNF